jgi:hypothetical protein
MRRSGVCGERRQLNFFSLFKLMSKASGPILTCLAWFAVENSPFLEIDVLPAAGSLPNFADAILAAAEVFWPWAVKTRLLPR